MDEVPWKAIIMVGGAIVALAIVSLVTGWATPYIQNILPH